MKAVLPTRSDPDSVCVALGPYRNLSTLTAATLFLHPHCQVLNHAGGQVFGNPDIDFLAAFSPARLDRFVAWAREVSAAGERGYGGGSITLSHAFDEQHALKRRFERAGLPLVKADLRCLFWKEPLRTSNWIRKQRIDLGAIFDLDSRLRFMLPIRNPIDCARSNLKTGHVRLFEGLDAHSSAPDVIDAILDEIDWFTQLGAAHPKRFFHFFAHDLSRMTLIRMATFLGIEPLEAWLADAMDVMQVTKPYVHDDDLKAWYRDRVMQRFAVRPDLCHGLLAFIDAA